MFKLLLLHTLVKAVAVPWGGGGGREPKNPKPEEKHILSRYEISDLVGIS